jgi:hypothetical protein
MTMIDARIKDLHEWLGSLSVIDQINFKTLLTMPMAVMKLPPGKYKDRALLALAIVNEPTEPVQLMDPCLHLQENVT